MIMYDLSSYQNKIKIKIKINIYIYFKIKLICHVEIFIMPCVTILDHN
jgi:hypothetical protein